MLGYAFVRPESEQNCSLGRINGALAPYNARFFVRINWHGETAQQSQLMPGSKGWKKQEPSVGERWVLGLRPRDSAGIAHLASVKRLTPRSRAHGHRLVGQTPLLLGIEARMGRMGSKYFHAVNVYISSVRRDKNL
jgi:hypothetical protein